MDRASLLAMEKISAQCYDYRLLPLLIKQQHYKGLNMEASPAPGWLAFRDDKGFDFFLL